MLQTDCNENNRDAQCQEEEIIGVDRWHRETANMHSRLRSALAGKRHAENPDRVNQIDTLRAVGDIDRRIEVIHEDTNDFTEAEGHDSEIVTPQLQCRRTE